MTRALGIGSACVVLVVAVPGRAHATEHQAFAGGSIGYAYLDEHYQWFSGFGGIGEMRYGLNDAIDLEFDASAYAYPTGRQIVPGTSAGLLYVVDVSHFVPQVGATVGFTDIVTYACPKDQRPCGSEYHVSVSLPGSFDLRITKHLSIGAHFRYTFLFPGQSSQITIGGGLSFSTAAKDGPVPFFWGK